MSDVVVRCPFCDQRHRVSRPPQDHPDDQAERQEDGGTAPVGEILGGAAIAASVVGLAAPVVANAGLEGAGFTGKGIGRGSLASKIQSKKGNVEKGSAFSSAQSFGAKGGFSQFGWLALGGALVAGAATLGFGAYHHHEEQRRRREEEIRNENNVCRGCWEMHKNVFLGGRGANN